MNFRCFYSFLIVLILVVSCKKSENRSCLKANGESVSYSLAYSNNTGYIEIYDDINVELIKDSLNLIEVETFKNIANFIEVQETDSSIQLLNKNRCEFLRKNTKQTTVKIHYTKLSTLALFGTGTIHTSSPIVQNEFRLACWSSHSKIQLKLNTNQFYASFVNGTVQGTIEGNTVNGSVFHSGNSNVNFEDLVTKFLFITNKSYADIKVNCVEKLIVELLNLGNVLYAGNPNEIEISQNTFNASVTPL